MPNRLKSATLKDVAAHAGVSIKTVSNVVNDWPYVSDETRQKVLDAIQEVGYRPNHMARSLVTGKTRTVGVLIPDIANPFFGTAIRGCEDVLFDGEYSLFLCNTNEVLEREQYYLDLLLSRGVDALIIWGTRIACHELEQIIGLSIPFVTVELDSDPCNANHISINVDNINGAFQAVGHLAQLGYQHIAHLGGPRRRLTANRRMEGYRQALDYHGLPFRPELVSVSPPTIQAGFRAALECLRNYRPDAIFCYNDLMALGAMIAARELGLEIPKDLAVVGFDDIVIAALTEPPLTTMRIQQYNLGRLTGRLVLDSLEKKTPPSQTILFPVELQVRESSDPALKSPEGRKSALANILNTLTNDTVDQAGDF